MPASIAMIAITTSSSISVKARGPSRDDLQTRVMNNPDWLRQRPRYGATAW
jgi:hypothetical protein